MTKLVYMLIILIALDSTGAKVTNRGEWIRHKWNVKKRQVILRIHVAVDIKPKRNNTMITSNQ